LVSSPSPADDNVLAQRIVQVRRAAWAEVRAFLAVQEACRSGPACCAALVRAWYGIVSLEAVLSGERPPSASVFAESLSQDALPRASWRLAPVLAERVLAAARTDLASDDLGPQAHELAEARQELLAAFADVKLRSYQQMRALRRPSPWSRRFALVAILAAAALALGFVLYRPRWRASYYGNRALSGEPAVVTTAFWPSHDWKYDGPVGVPTDKFSARFETCLVLEKPAEITFSLGSDDGSRLFVDGRRIIDLWAYHAYEKQEQTAQIDAGAHSVRVEYYDEGGLAKLTFDAKGDGLSGGGSFSRYLRLPPRGSSSCRP